MKQRNSIKEGNQFRHERKFEKNQRFIELSCMLSFLRNLSSNAVKFLPEGVFAPMTQLGFL